MVFQHPVLALVAVLRLTCTDAYTLSANAGVTPVQKVIQLLGDMQAKSKQEMMDEQVAFAEFSTFCKNEKAAKANEIQQEKEEIESLGASILKANADADQLGKEIADLNNELDQNTATKKAQEEERAAEHKENMASLADYDESLDALDRAINVLSKQSHDRKQADAASLLQLSTSAMMPERAKQLIKAFLQMSQDPEGGEGYGDYEAPEANAYESQSGGIIDMLKGLKDKFRKERGDLEKAEMNSKHAFNMMLQDLTDSINRGNKAISEKGAEKSSKHESAATDSKEKAATEADLAEDEKYLSDLTAECEQKGKSFEEKQQLRKEEIEAIGKAIEILSGDAVSGAADKHLPGLVQQAVSLVQLRSSRHAVAQEGGVHARLTAFLDQESHRLHSKSLALLAQRVAADPFAKVKKMIDEMITKLLEEANAEAEQKGFCDKELGTNKITRDKLSSDIEKLQAEIEQAEATIAKLGEEITELTAGVEELDAAMAKYTEEREAEKAKNTQTIEDAVGAQKAVEAAVAVLKEFYEKAAGATALVQTGASTRPQSSLLSTRGIKMGSDEWNALANPNAEPVDEGHKAGEQTFGETYKGQQDEAGGVLAMLEVIMSDFSNLEADTKAAENAAEKAYTDFMNDAKQDKAVKLKSIEMKTADRQATEKKHNTDVKDMKATQDELLAADRYYEKLKPECVDAGVVSYEDRVKAREAEIESLRTALKILSGSDIA